jgi:hypothetical protein
MTPDERARLEGAHERKGHIAVAAHDDAAACMSRMGARGTTRSGALCGHDDQPPQ